MLYPFNKFLNETRSELEFNVNQINVNPNTYVMQMIENGEIIGEVEFMEASRIDDDIAEINGVNINQDKQGSGYGMILYQKLIEYLKQRGYFQLFSDHISKIKNDAIHKIWQNLGAEWDDINKVYVLDLK